jgi:hypothetical protein
MRGLRKAITCAMITGVTIGATTAGASAACANIAGTWHFFAMQGSTPNIKSTTTTVRNGAGTPVSIRVFPPTGTPFDNSTSTSIKCKFTITAAGGISGPCTAYGVSASDGGNVSLSGSATLNGCEITGGMLNTGEPTKVTLLGGYIKMTSSTAGTASGVMRQGADQVFLFNMIKH